MGFGFGVGTKMLMLQMRKLRLSYSAPPPPGTGRGGCRVRWGWARRAGPRHRACVIRRRPLSAGPWETLLFGMAGAYSLNKLDEFETWSKQKLSEEMAKKLERNKAREHTEPLPPPSPFPTRRGAPAAGTLPPCHKPHCHCAKRHTPGLSSWCAGGVRRAVQGDTGRELPKVVWNEVGGGGVLLAAVPTSGRGERRDWRQGGGARAPHGECGLRRRGA